MAHFVLELNPAGADGYFNLGNARLATGRADAALAAYRRALDEQIADRSASRERVVV